LALAGAALLVPDVGFDAAVVLFRTETSAVVEVGIEGRLTAIGVQGTNALAVFSVPRVVSRTPFRATRALAKVVVPNQIGGTFVQLFAKTLALIRVPVLAITTLLRKAFAFAGLGIP
jgi:hypothetical protein